MILLDGLADKAKHYVARMGSPAWVRETDALTAVNSNIPSDTFNCVIVRDIDEQTGRAAISDICASFNAAGLPAAWWTGDGLRASFVARELARNHFIEDETNVGMLAELGSLPPPVECRGFELRMVQTSEEVLVFGRLLASLSDPPDPHTLAYYAMVRKLEPFDGGPMRLFIGRVDGQPLCTASLFLHEDTGHVFDVSTAAAFRGRGLGAAVMDRVLRHARAAGARRAGVGASEEGLGVYRRIGFEDVGVLRVYSNKRHLGEIHHA